MRRARRGLNLALGLALLAVPAPAPASAQEPADDPPSLERVEELTRIGRTEEARKLLLAWWEEVRPDASRRDRQRAYWLRGRLTVDPAQATLDFRRLVIQYPGGPFSDQALLRLAQAAWARGDAETAEARLAQLERDYPGSPVNRVARSWRTQAGPLPEAVEVPPETADTTVGADAPGAEERAEAVDDAGPDAPGEAGEEVEEPARGTFAVQLGAFASESRARALRERVEAGGYEVRLVRVEGSRLLHVRVGRFEEMEEAEALLAEIRGQGLAAALVRDADREEGVSR